MSGTSPCDKDVKQIEHLQDSLHAQFAMLDQSQLDMSGSSRLTVISHNDDSFSQFDDLDNDNNEAADNSSLAPALAHHDWLLAVVLVEWCIPCMPCMPSTYESANLTYRIIELVLWRWQACQHLTDLWGAIADKSFQYSQVLHVAPGKMICNCARSSIKKLNDVISFYCHAYTKCHLAMIWLAAGEHILSSFPMLSKNKMWRLAWHSWLLTSPGHPLFVFPGYGRLISWQQKTPHQPCKNVHAQFAIYNYLIALSVRCVHWLRARAQKEHWEEEVILIQYEMQWTVQYFLHNRGLWEEHHRNSIGLGLVAYAAHKASMWNFMALHADHTFSEQNSQYKRLMDWIYFVLHIAGNRYVALYAVAHTGTIQRLLACIGLMPVWCRVALHWHCSMLDWYIAGLHRGSMLVWCHVALHQCCSNACILLQFPLLAVSHPSFGNRFTYTCFVHVSSLPLVTTAVE